MEVTRDLLLKYDRPGPRYTSYPTAPEWHADFGPFDYQQALSRASRSDEPLSLYVHLPFCASRCLYCGCNVIVSRDRTVLAGYLETISGEIAQVAEMLGTRRTVSQLHWGGGTPNHLTPDEMRHLFAVITKHFTLLPDAEVAIEIDPCSVNSEQLVTLRNLGFNRVSIGVQDLSPAVQEAVMRDQTPEITHLVYNECRALGFSGINMDLIYGLPLQTLPTWEKTIDIVLAMRPDRLAVYGFAFLPERLPHQRLLEKLTMPTGPEKYELFARARNRFLQAGYRAIGMDHFALPEDELARALDAHRLSRNFMGYTVQAAPDQIGFGVSSISEVGGVYAQNQKSLEEYQAAFAAGQLATVVGVALGQDDIIRRWVIRELMCNFQLSHETLKNLFGIEFLPYFSAEQAELTALAEEGLIILHPDRLEVTGLGAVFVRNLCMVFDARLRRSRQSVQFSRTI